MRSDSRSPVRTAGGSSPIRKPGTNASPPPRGRVTPSAKASAPPLAVRTCSAVWSGQIPQLVRGDPRRQLIPESEAFDLRAVLELVEAGVAAADRAAKGLRIAFAVSKMVTIGEDDLAGRFSPLEPLEALARHGWVQNDPGELEVIGVHRDPDLRVDRGPVVDAGERSAHRAMRYELEHERTEELGPCAARDLGTVGRWRVRRSSDAIAGTLSLWARSRDPASFARSV